MATVFYSWQSDLSKKINRYFIEDAIGKAIKNLNRDLSLQRSARDESLIIDKDTKGIPGTPPIVDTIFQKISKCGIFIPDLTFVGRTKLGRDLPNPNVLIEYGWALNAVGNSRIIPIMNKAFGKPNAQTLPFNMRHLRHPITYMLKGEMSPGEQSKVKAGLIKELTGAIKLILQKELFDKGKKEGAVFQGAPWTINPSTFLEEGKALASRRTREKDLIFHVPNVARIFLRLIPESPVQPTMTTKKAYDLSIDGNLAPMGDRGGYSRDRNKFGACIYADENGKVSYLTQLFKSGELWGIDADIIDKQSLMKWGNVDFGFLPCSLFERTFIDTLKNYLNFASSILKLKLPLRLVVGATDVMGYRMTAPSGAYFPGLARYGGNVVEDNIIYEGEITNYESKPTEILRPFFDHVWEECGLTRPDQEML